MHVGMEYLLIRAIITGAPGTECLPFYFLSVWVVCYIIFDKWW